MLYSSSLCMVGFAPFSPRGETCLPARKPPFMHRERRGKLGSTLSKQRRSIYQLVPSMEGRKNRGSYFMRRISKCSLDGDEGLHQLQSRSCYKTTWLSYERSTTRGRDRACHFMRSIRPMWRHFRRSARHGRCCKRKTRNSEAVTMGPSVATVSG